MQRKTLVALIAIAAVSVQAQEDRAASFESSQGITILYPNVARDVYENAWISVVPRLLAPAETRRPDGATLSYAGLPLFTESAVEFDALRDTLDPTEAAALTAYLVTGRKELEALRRRELRARACQGNATTGAELGAALAQVEALHAGRVRELVEGLAAVVDAKTNDGIMAKAAGQQDIVRLGRGSNVDRYSGLTGAELEAEFRRVCSGPWMYHDDSKLV